eukprot:2177822-Amphidinium_carterae.3
MLRSTQRVLGVNLSWQSVQLTALESYCSKYSTHLYQAPVAIFWDFVKLYLKLHSQSLGAKEFALNRMMIPLLAPAPIRGGSQLF